MDKIVDQIITVKVIAVWEVKKVIVKMEYASILMCDHANNFLMGRAVLIEMSVRVTTATVENVVEESMIKLLYMEASL